MIALLALCIVPGDWPVAAMSAVAAIMAVWWLTEALPLGATALLPVLLLPLMGIVTLPEIASSYFNSTIFLFLGGFLIAIAMEKCGLHKRISLKIISATGGRISGLIFGFMLTSAFLSMFISNTATAIMLLPISMSIISKLEAEFPGTNSRNYIIPLLLAIAYGASAGGVATLVGTPPNLVLLHHINEIGLQLSFVQWMKFGIPLSISVLLTVWIVLYWKFIRKSPPLRLSPEIMLEQKKSIGPMQRDEKIMLVVFGTTALLWLWRQDIDFGQFTLPGWASLSGLGKRAGDASVAIAMALLLFLLPGRKGCLLSSNDIGKVPWEIIVLFGGGFALAKGIQMSGLAAIISDQFGAMGSWPQWVMLFIIAIGISFLTEFTSNTATAQTVLPILAPIAISSGLSPVALMVPAAVSASFAFMMPVATPPNAIIFGSGRIKIRDMARTGVILNIIGAVIVVILYELIGSVVFQ